jgi:cell division topological specificity factor
MNIADYFRRPRTDTAAIAKERLQIIVAHERSQRNEPDFLPRLQQELLEVIRKYVNVDQEQVEVQLDNNGNCSVLELNVVLPGVQ